ncbi:MAG: HNH endonuclease [Candidatus Schekmanbacteria bacterium]|nr:HNH endonuclease [Candidatus Schekmanbacteria bacterium]
MAKPYETIRMLAFELFTKHGLYELSENIFVEKMRKNFPDRKAAQPDRTHAHFIKYRSLFKNEKVHSNDIKSGKTKGNNSTSTDIGGETDLPAKTETTIIRTIRDTKVTKPLKDLYKNKCQICGKTIQLGNDKFYSEAHHLKPLGNDHNGSDKAGNIIVLCPNHHVEFDYGVVAINSKTLTVISNNEFSGKKISFHSKHKIDKENLEYHYNEIFSR